MKRITWLIALSMTSPLTQADSLQDKVQQQVRADLDKVNAPALQQLTSINHSRGAGSLVTVGQPGDTDCDFNAAGTSIQDAIDSGAQEIRISAEAPYFQTVVINDLDVFIQGGYANCADAATNTLNGDFTTLDGSMATGPIIELTGDTMKNTVILRRLKLENANDSAIESSQSDVLLEINNGIIQHNTTNGMGGGLSVFGGDADVIIRDSRIFNNSAGFGGGIGCQGFQASITMVGNNGINQNQATSNGGISSGSGGGLFLAQACRFSMYAADDALDFDDSGEATRGGMILASFSGNQARNEGGAISSINNSELYLFGQRMCVDGECLGDDANPLRIIGNSSDTDGSGGDGGGAIWLRGTGNVAVMNGVFIENNDAGGNGGSFLLEDGASLTVYRDHKACWQDVFCNALFSGEADTNVGLGGLVYNDDSMVDISNAFISEHRADFGTVLYATGEQSVTRIESSIINDNGDDGSGSWSDNHVISVNLGAAVELVHNTFVDNHAELGVFNVNPALNSSMNLQSSIVDDASSGDVLSGAAGPTTIHCLMAHENLSFSGTQVVVDDPQFVDPAMGDFSLDPVLSPAIDFCDDSQAVIMHPDINFENRGWDDPGFDNNQGPFDLGADESQVNDIIFADGLND